MNEEWIKLKEKDEIAWRKEHGDNVIKIDGQWYTESELLKKKNRARARADKIVARIEKLK